MSSTVQRALRAEGGLERRRPEAPGRARGVVGALTPIMIVLLIAYLLRRRGPLTVRIERMEE